MSDRTPTKSQPPFEILIAEDNRGDMLLIREALHQEQIPCNVHAAGDGETAIALISQRDQEPQPVLDLLIVDMHLPLCDGLAVLERLRNATHLRHTPAIVLSGLTVDRISKQIKSYPLVHAFHKSSDLHEFLALGQLVHRVLHHAQPTPGNDTALQAEGAA